MTDHSVQTSEFGGVFTAIEALLGTLGLSLPGPAPRFVGRTRAVRLPVERHFGAALAQGASGAAAVRHALGAVADRLVWQRNPGYRDAAFLEGYGYCELGGPSGHWATDAYAVGVLLLAPGIEYPAHAHPASETYVILSGEPEWWLDSGPWERRCEGDVLRHGSGVVHAMRSGVRPLLALYHWADHLDVPARLLRQE